MENRKKYPLSFYLITFLMPFLLFGLLEVGLRIAVYGTDEPTFISVPGTDEKLMVLNPNLTKRYFKSSSFVPQSINDVFTAEKEPNTLRIFILGESSAAGFPYEPNGSFSRFLKVKLNLLFPNKKIEVVNLGIAAINSYAICDILEDVIDQKPDAVLIYSGHNEYYGTLGAASMTNVGDSPGLTRFIISMNKLRSIRLISSIFSGSEQSGTPKDLGLMESLAKDKYIPLNSDIYKAGVNQFENNLNYILSELTDNNIPVIIGNLVSNLLNQPPFISERSKAGTIFSEAKHLYDSGEYEKAKLKFIEAKENDELRFRAPEEFNQIIKKLASENNARLLLVDSVFSAKSRNGVVGNDLMTDHLHPNLTGYNLLADIFLSGLVSSGLLKDKPAISIENDKLDSLTKINFPFSALDSAIAQYRLLGIKSQWPFNRSEKKLTLEQMRPCSSFIDTIAIQTARGELQWDVAHTKVARQYLLQKDTIKLLKEYDVLISQFPYITKFYNMLAENWMEFKLYDKALTVLNKSYLIKPTAFSTKWIGIISLNNGKADDAKKWLSESLNYNGIDAQTLYNLAGAFINLKDYTSAKLYILKCLEIDNKFPGAKQLASQLANVK
jgi:lysophospholipase L1-like esterase